MTAVIRRSARHAHESVSPLRPPPKRRNIAVSAVTVVVILAGSAVAITVLSTPAPRYAYITVALPSLPLPQAMTLDLPKTSAIAMRGANLTLADIRQLETIDLRDKKSKPTQTGPIAKLDITESGDIARSAVRLRPRGKLGLFQIRVPIGALFSADCEAPQNSICVRYKAPSNGRMRISFLADRLDFDSVARVKLQPNPLTADHASGLPGEYKLIATNNATMVGLTGTISDELTLVFPRINNFSSREPNRPPASWLSDNVRLPNARLLDATFQGKDAAQVSLAALSEISLTPAGRFDWIEVSATSDDRSASRQIRVSGRGVVASLQQDGRELLPTRLSDILTAKPETRGLWGGAALLVISTGAILLKRAVDNLVKLILPE